MSRATLPNDFDGHLSKRLNGRRCSRFPRWWNPGAVKVQRNYLGVSLYRGGFHGQHRGLRTSNTRLSGGLIVPSATVRACQRCLTEDRRRSIVRSSYQSIYELGARLNRFPFSTPLTICKREQFFFATASQLSARPCFLITLSR